MKYLIFTVLIFLLWNCQPSYYTIDDQYEYSEIELAHKDTVPDSANLYAYFKNSSFEIGNARHSTLAENWLSCRAFDESLPDLFSNRTRFFEVSTKAAHAFQYVCMVIRENNTFENIAQYLEEPLEWGVKYGFLVDLARSPKLMSPSKKTFEMENFNEAAILRIWAGSSECEEGQLLFETKPIEHTKWGRYWIEFTMEEDFDYLKLEAYYSNSSDFRYNGNLLLDNLSPIYKLE